MAGMDRAGRPSRTRVASPPGATERRRQRADAGVAELLVWLEDQVATGLARLQPDAYDRFDDMAARLVDAQVPGLARRVRALAGVTASGPGWSERLLAELALLNALARAHRRLDDLPEPLAATVRSHVGYPVRKASVLQLPTVSDAWYVVGRRDESDGVLTTRRTWLVGGGTGRPALILSFATRGERLDDSLAVGTVLLADLHFYPGSLPMRALVGAVHAVLGPDRHAGPAGPDGPGPPPPPPTMSVAQARRRWSASLERDPWVRRTSLVLSVAPARPGGEVGGAAVAPAYWRDADGDLLLEQRRVVRAGGAGPTPVGAEPVDLRWVALAVGGGEPVPLAVELGDGGVTPLTVWTPTGCVPAASSGRRM